VGGLGSEPKLLYCPPHYVADFSLGTRWFKTAAKLIAFVVLNIYAAALIIAAWPNGEDFGALRPVHQSSLDLFDRLKIRSGTAVFSGNRGAWKRKSLCISVLGTNDQSQPVTLYQSYPHCEVPDIRVFEDTFYVLLMRAGHGLEMKRFLGASSKGVHKELLRLQNSGSLDRASKYFCESELSGAKEFKAVDILWEVKQVHYGSGKVRTDLVHAHSYDCRKKRRDSRSYRTSEVHKTESGDLALRPKQAGRRDRSSKGAR
jgi:hypothetical protein